MENALLLGPLPPGLLSTTSVSRGCPRCHGGHIVSRTQPLLAGCREVEDEQINRARLEMTPIRVVCAVLFALGLKNVCHSNLS